MKPNSNPFLAALRPASVGFTVVLSVAGLSSQSAHAANTTNTWAGGTSQDWLTATNWSLAHVPADDAANVETTIINTATGNVPIYSTVATAVTDWDLFVGRTTGNSGRLDQTSGTIQTGATTANWLFIGVAAATGTYNLANTATAGGGISGFAQGGGSISSNRIWVGGADNNDNGTGTFNINTTGTITTAGLYVGGGWNSGVANGTVNFESGIINSTGEVRVGRASNGTWNQSGGTLTDTTYFVVGRESGLANNFTAGNGTVNLTGGTINAATTTAGSFAVLGSFANSVGAMTVSGTGTFNSTRAGGGLVIGETGTGTFTVSAAGSGLVDLSTTALRLGVNAGGTGTVNLNGGTIQAGSVTKGGGTGTFNFNGGTLKAMAASGTFMNGLTTATVQSGGAIVNSNGFDVTIGQALLAGAPSGGLTKTGGIGKLTLSGTNTYTGTTLVNAGTLALGGTGDINTSSGITVNGSGAKFLQTSGTASTPAITLTQGTLDGTGTVGVVTVGAGTGGVVTNGNGTAGQLTADSLTFSGAATMNLNIAGGNPFSNVPPVVVSNGLTASGGVGSILVNVSPITALEIGSTYDLVTYGTSFTGATNKFVYSGNSARITGTFGNSGSAITLTLNGDAPKWTGLDAGGQWKTGATGANKNWKLQTAGTATDYLAGDLVLFDDSVTTGTTAVDISAADVSPGSTTFDNTDKNYTISSSGGFGIAGTGGVFKSGTGSVTFKTVNTTNGAITISAGTFQLGDGTTDGSFTNSGNLINDGTLVYNRSTGSTFTYPNVISGLGSVVKNGAGTQILGGANTYIGGTTVNLGTLQLTTTAGAANTGTFNLNGGAFQVNLGAGTNFGYNPTINLTAASTIGNAAAGSLANLQGQINHTGTLTGNGNALNVVNTGLARLYLNGTLTDVSQINVLSGAMGFDLNSGNNRGTAPVSIAGGASLYFAGNNASPITNNLTFNGGTGINGSALFYEGGVVNPAALTGTVTLANGTTTVGGAFAADTVTLSGLITGSGGLTKVTANKYTLTGTNDYTGATLISAGTLQIGDGATTGSLSTSSTIEDNGTFAINRTNAVTQGIDFSGAAISGTGALTVSGAGNVTTLNATNTYTGSTTANTGTTLVLRGNNTLSTGNVLLNNGATIRLEAGAGNTTGSVSTALGLNPAAGASGFMLGNDSNGAIGIQLRSNSSAEFANTTTGNNSGNVTLNFNVDNIGAVAASGPQNGVLTFAPVTEVARNNGNGLSTFNTNINVDGQNGYSLAIGKIVSLGNQTTINSNTANLTIGSIGETASTTLNFGGAGTTTVTGAVTNAAGILTLNRLAGGTTILLGTNSYTGATTVSGGRLSVATASLSDTAAVSIATGGELNLTHTATDQIGSLSVGGGAALPDGTYDKDSPATVGFITGTGKLHVGVVAGGYAAYAGTHGLSTNASEDTDADGVRNGIEYFMNAAIGFTANPGIVSGKITWPKGPSFSGTYSVQTSPDLVNWSNVASTVVGNTVEYTVPAGQGKLFVRLNVVPN